MVTRALAADAAVIVFERICFRMGMQKHFCVFVPNGNRVVVSQFYLEIKKQQIRL